jgi:hypothetical protein
MCIIAICKNNALDKETFKRCFQSNSHGVGFAWSNGHEVCYRKGFMDVEPAWTAYEGTPLPHVVHFRLASVGGVKKELTHPFTCSAASPLAMDYEGTEPVLFHNGSISDWKTILTSCVINTKVIPAGDMSDSRAMAVAVGIAGVDFLLLYNGKYAVVTPTEILTVGDFETDEDTGNLFSNNGYKASRFTPVVYNNDTDWYRQTGFSFNRDNDCKDCKFFNHDREEIYCNALNRPMRDTRACNRFEKSTGEPEVRDCTECKKFRFSNDGFDYCNERKEIIHDLTVCEKFKVSKSRFIKRTTDKKKRNKEISGAEIVDGVVQENFLERIKKLKGAH